MFEKTQNNSFSDELVDEILEISLVFVGDKLNKDFITDTLETSPTNSWNSNEVLEIGSLKKIKIAAIGKWFLKINAKSENLDTSIQNLLKKLPKNIESWHYINNFSEGYIEITAYQSLWNHNYNLSFKTLKMLSERNLNLVFETYNTTQTDF